MLHCWTQGYDYHHTVPSHTEDSEGHLQVSVCFQLMIQRSWHLRNYQLWQNGCNRHQGNEDKLIRHKQYSQTAHEPRLSTVVTQGAFQEETCLKVSDWKLITVITLKPKLRLSHLRSSLLRVRMKTNQKESRYFIGKFCSTKLKISISKQISKSTYVDHMLTY